MPLQSPIPLDSINHLPVKLVVLESNNPAAIYTFTYTSNEYPQRVTEHVFSDTTHQLIDSNYCDFEYNHSQLAQYTWQNFSDTKKTVHYTFEYDDQEHLISVSRNNEKAYKKVNDIRFLDTQIILDDNQGLWPDTINIKPSANTNLKEVYSNQFYLYGYEQKGNSLILAKGAGLETLAVFSSKANELVHPFNWVLFRFLTRTPSTNVFESPLCPDTYFFFDPINQLILKNFPVQYKGENYAYAFDNFDRIKTIKHTTNSTVNEMQFYY